MFAVDTLTVDSRVTRISLISIFRLRDSLLESDAVEGGGGGGGGDGVMHAG